MSTQQIDDAELSELQYGKEFFAKAVCVHPHTGQPRHVLDIISDPQAKLCVKSPLIAASRGTAAPSPSDSSIAQAFREACSGELSHLTAGDFTRIVENRAREFPVSSGGRSPCYLCDGKGYKPSHTGSVWCEACKRTGYLPELSAPAAAVGGDDLLGNSIAQAYEEARVGQVFDCANDAFDWIEERAREINGVASSEKPCLRCGDARRILSGPRSFGEVTTIPCPDCNLYRDDYISGAELESRLDTLVEEYEWDDGESRHVPTETERLLLVDFAHGILADELFVAMLKAHYDPNSRNRPAAPVGGFVVDKYAANSWDFNGCHGQAVKALRYLAKYGRCPDGGSEFPNMECCQQIADELERSFAAIQATSPAAQPSAKDGVHDFSDNNGSACIVCGAGELFTGTPCPGAKDGVRVELTDTYVQEVPDKCDRIIWRGQYHHLPLINSLGYTSLFNAIAAAVACENKEYAFGISVQAFLDSIQQKATTAAGLVDGWRSMDSAPRDGSNILLLVRPESTPNWNILDDADHGRTIGAWQEDDQRFEFVGWDWQQDAWESGCGEPVAWQPLPPNREAAIGREEAK